MHPHHSSSELPATPADANEDDRHFVTALARGLEVLRCFGPDRPELGASEIAKLISLPQPTVWRLCHTLKSLGYLVPGAGNGKLRVGAPVLSLGLASLVELEFAELIRPHLQEFIERYPAAVVLAERHQLSLVYVLRCEGAGPFVLKRPVGSTISLYESTAGLACLAGMTEPERAETLQRIQARDPSGWAAVQQPLADARAEIAERGFVVTINAQGTPVSYAAAPVSPRGSRRAFTLLCGGPSFSLSRANFEQEIGPKLVSLAQMAAVAISATATT
jgi:DNA-binding IclR family transcriptional regulator